MSEGRSGGPPPLIRYRLWGLSHPDAGLGLCDVASVLCDTKVPISDAGVAVSERDERWLCVVVGVCEREREDTV